MASDDAQVRLDGSERRPTPDAQLVGPAKADATITVTLRLRRRPDAPPLEDAGRLAAEAGVRHLSREQFAAHYGATPEDLKPLKRFARTHGLKLGEQSLARRVVQLSGTIAQMDAAFGVELGIYRSPTETYRGHDGYVHISPELAGIVEGVFGLDNRRMARRAMSSEGPELNPAEVANLYKFPSAGDATGQTIGLIEFGKDWEIEADGTEVEVEAGYKLEDVEQFFKNLKRKTPTLHNVEVLGVKNNPVGEGDAEFTLDIDVAGAVAPGAEIAVYITEWTENGWVEAISSAVHDATNKPSVLSISYGWPELDKLGFTWSKAAIEAVSEMFKEATALGVTVFVSTGDHGSSCGLSGGTARVEYPGSDPSVTAVGGTAIEELSGSSFKEVTWVESGRIFDVTGGGISEVFEPPTWQADAKVPVSANPGGAKGRGIPDVAAYANGYKIAVNGSEEVYVGTSEAAPLYAGLAALLNASLKQNVGYLNPLLYALNGTSVFRDINDGASNATNGAPGYKSGPGWDACTGLGVIEGEALLAALQARFTRDCTIITNQNSFSKDEAEALLHASPAEVVKEAFYVTVDGFTPAELGITTATPNPTQLHEWAPRMTLSPALSELLVVPSGLLPELPSLPDQPQRFTFVYNVEFTGVADFTKEVLPVTLTAKTHGLTASAQIELITKPDPHMHHGDTWYLSTDLRVFKLKPGETLQGSSVKMGSDAAEASSFIKEIIKEFNKHGPVNHPFELLSTEEESEASTLELSEKVKGVPVFNFAVARVRYRALAVDAEEVRVFFRLFQASTTSTNFEPSTYPIGGAGTTKIPLLGVEAGELVTIPCFAEPRVASDTKSLDEQEDPDNVQTIEHDPSGAERDAYFGCWLDINQSEPQFPALPGSSSGPFTSGRQTIQELVRNLHQCLVAEIDYKPDPIETGATTADSDKLSQRNLSIVESDNPGGPASHRIPDTFDVRPTSSRLPAGWTPDEIMIDWGNTPTGSEATIYLPRLEADQILDMAATLYGGTPLRRVDDSTLSAPVGGATWIPVPAGEGPSYAGLLTIQLPASVTRGEGFKVVVRQISSRAGKVTPPPPPPLQAGRSASPASHRAGGASVAGSAGTSIAVPVERLSIQQRYTLGAFQITIPVRTKKTLLGPEERALSVLAWIAQSISPQDRWFPVFRRYLEVISERVAALGGDPARIEPSPDGSGVPGERLHGSGWPPGKGGPPWREGLPGRGGRHPGKGEPGWEQGADWHRLAFTGKVSGLVYDGFGDFDGFELETEEHELRVHRFYSREVEVEELVERAWAQRIRTTVIADHRERSVPLKIILRDPPPWSRRRDLGSV